jgi:putative membrane protein
MTRGPGFVDTPQSESAEPPAAKPAMARPAPNSDMPILLDAVPGESRARIDPLWEPEIVARRKSGSNQLSWLAGGLAVLALSWLALSLAAFAQDQFNRSAGLGWLTLGCFGGALAMVGYGLWGEVRAWRALHRVEDLRHHLSRADLSAAQLRALLRPWLRIVGRHLDDDRRIMAAIEAAATSIEIAALLGEVDRALRQAAQQAGKMAALQGGAVVAITPAPALEGILAAARGLILIRQIAGIYGIRPGLLVTFALLRRVVWAAAGVTGLAVLSQTLADQVLSKVPVIKHLASAVPEASLAALRLYRLAGITAEACSPVAGSADPPTSG